MQRDDGEAFFVQVIVRRPFVQSVLDHLTVLHSIDGNGLFVVPITLKCRNFHHNTQADPYDFLDSHQHIIVGFCNRQAYEGLLQHDYVCPKGLLGRLQEEAHMSPIFRLSSVIKETKAESLLNDPHNYAHQINLGPLNREFVSFTNERMGKSAMIYCVLCQKRIKASGAFNHVLTEHVVDRLIKCRDPQVLRRCTRLVCYCENIFQANDALSLIVHIWRCGLQQKDHTTIVAFVERQQIISLIYRPEVEPRPLCTRKERNYCIYGCDPQAHIPVQNFQSVFLTELIRENYDDVDADTLRRHVQTAQEWYGTNRPFH